MIRTQPQLNHKTRCISPWCLAGVMTSILTLSACASAPQPPTEALQAAEQAIANADQARVTEHAPAELAEARAKLVAAREAVDQEKMKLALRLAEQSRIDAELAMAKAAAAKAQAVNQEMQKGNDALKQEMLRNNKGVR